MMRTTLAQPNQTRRAPLATHIDNIPNVTPIVVAASQRRPSLGL